MESFLTHTGIGVPLRRSDVDTDQIVPAVWLKRVARTGFEEGLFSRWREDPDFVLNHAVFGKGTVLVAGPDFGTGSSREAAVWALQQYGFTVVVSSRFADIFRGNAGKGGLVTAQVEQSAVEEIWAALEAQPGTTITVDLPGRTVTCADRTYSFQIDDYVAWRIENGYDDVSLTLQHEEDIARFEEQRPYWKPVVTSAVGGEASPA